METEALLNAEMPTKAQNRQTPASLQIVNKYGICCPICLFPTGRLIRNKIHCGNCGFIES
jgi:hypothetical protein